VLRLTAALVRMEPLLPTVVMCVARLVCRFPQSAAASSPLYAMFTLTFVFTNTHCPRYVECVRCETHTRWLGRMEEEAARIARDEGRRARVVVLEVGAGANVPTLRHLTQVSSAVTVCVFSFRDWPPSLDSGVYCTSRVRFLFM
jgi:hypothetical protein